MIASHWSVLGLQPGASSAEIRARYRALVKKHPPDRDPETFERIRDAYRQLIDRDPRMVLAERLFGPPRWTGLAELVDALRPQRRPVGANVWYEALKELAR